MERFSTTLDLVAPFPTASMRVFTRTNSQAQIRTSRKHTAIHKNTTSRYLHPLHKIITAAAASKIVLMISMITTSTPMIISYMERWFLRKDLASKASPTWPGSAALQHDPALVERAASALHQDD